jgi:hypothetical protein
MALLLDFFRILSSRIDFGAFTPWRKQRPTNIALFPRRLYSWMQ